MIVDAFALRKKHDVMKDTWGHTYPEPGSKHTGRILVMSHDGNDTMLDRNFPTLQCSPQEHALVCSVLDKFEWVNGLHVVSCTLWFFKTVHDAYLGGGVGKIIKASVETVHPTETW